MQRDINENATVNAQTELCPFFGMNAGKDKEFYAWLAEAAESTHPISLALSFHRLRSNRLLFGQKKNGFQLLTLRCGDGTCLLHRSLEAVVEDSPQNIIALLLIMKNAVQLHSWCSCNSLEWPWNESLRKKDYRLRINTEQPVIV
jgi:hypothetical protein